MIWLTTIILTALAAHLGYRNATAMARSGLRLDSQPQYHAAYAALCAFVPTAILLIIFNIAASNVMWHEVATKIPSLADAASGHVSLALSRVRAIAAGSEYVMAGDKNLAAAVAYVDEAVKWRHIAAISIAVVCAAIGIFFALSRMKEDFPARKNVEKFSVTILALSSMAAILVTVMIVFSVAVEAWHFFSKVPLGDFLFDLHWSPQIAMRADQAGSSGSFGVIPLITGTLLITLVALVVAVTIGLMAAIYMSEYASRRVRAVAKPALEMLAGIPTVVYGYFAALVVAPFLHNLGVTMKIEVDTESALAAGLVMGVMILPFVSSLADDVIHAIPQTLRDAGMALGSTKSEVIRKVILPAATPGVISSVLLAISRAIGETMIVLMAAGMAANLTFNPLQSTTTVTVQIVSLLLGDQEFDNPKTLAAYALGLTLFIITLALNLVALRIVKNYRKKYA